MSINPPIVTRLQNLTELQINNAGHALGLDSSEMVIAFRFGGMGIEFVFPGTKLKCLDGRVVLTNNRVSDERFCQVEAEGDSDNTSIASWALYFRHGGFGTFTSVFFSSLASRRRILASEQQHQLWAEQELWAMYAQETAALIQAVHVDPSDETVAMTNAQATAVVQATYPSSFSS